jgi:hypothetical protein
MHINTKFRIAEFIVAGLALDLLENIISIKLTTGAAITKEVFITALLVVIPFAIVTEIIIDHPKFWHHTSRVFKKMFGLKNN